MIKCATDHQLVKKCVSPQKKDEKSEVSYTEFLAGVINLRCKTPEDRDFDQPKIAAPAVGRSGCGRNKTDFYGLHGHSFVLTSMDWLGGLRCCVAQGEKNHYSDEA